MEFVFLPSLKKVKTNFLFQYFTDKNVFLVVFFYVVFFSSSFSNASKAKACAFLRLSESLSPWLGFKLFFYVIYIFFSSSKKRHWMKKKKYFTAIPSHRERKCNIRRFYFFDFLFGSSKADYFFLFERNVRDYLISAIEKASFFI